MKKSYSFVFKSLLIVLLFNFALIAQDEEFDLSDLEGLMIIEVSVASTRSETIFNTPSTVSVIDKEFIANFNITSVSEAIDMIPGFFNTRTYLKRNLPTSRGIMQDHYANKVLVLINGIASWHGTTGEGNIDRININDVERIEVLRGPASVLYGTNAYSGAVNVVLKSESHGRSNFHLGMGENGKFEGGGNVNFRVDDFDFFVSGNSDSETGPDYTFTDESGNTGKVKEYVKSNNFNFTVNNDSHSFLFNGYSVDESYLGVTPKFSSGAGTNSQLKGFLTNYSLTNKLSEKLELRSSLTYDWNSRLIPRSSDDSVKAEVIGFRALASSKFLYSLDDIWDLEFGGDFEFRKSVKYDNINPFEDRVIAENNLKDRDVNEFSLFSQLKYNSDFFDVVAGSRYSNNELFGNNVSARGTLVFKFNDKNSLKLIYGSSYRAPSLFELYFTTPSFTVFGYDEIKNKKSNSLELSYLTLIKNFMINVLAYHSNYENKIFRERKDVVLEDGTILTNKSVYSNGGTFSANGLELQVQYINTSVINGFVNYNYLDGDNGDEIDGNGNYNFKYVPKHTVTLGLSKKINDFNISSTVNFIGGTNGPNDKIDSQLYFDFGINYKHEYSNFIIHHKLSVKNFTDELVIVPEYVRRRTINELSNGFGRRISYSIQVEV